MFNEIFNSNEIHFFNQNSFKKMKFEHQKFLRKRVVSTPLI